MTRFPQIATLLYEERIRGHGSSSRQSAGFLLPFEAADVSLLIRWELEAPLD